MRLTAAFDSTAVHLPSIPSWITVPTRNTRGSRLRVRDGKWAAISDYRVHPEYDYIACRLPKAESEYRAKVLATQGNFARLDGCWGWEECVRDRGHVCMLRGE